MINFIFSMLVIWLFVVVSLVAVYILDTYLITPICCFFSDNPIISYLGTCFLATVLIYAAILAYYRKHPDKKLPGWLQKTSDKSPDLRKLLNR
jgi:uncharacterized BrkB/YihY/UPF0761 family membrane protein